MADTINAKMTRDATKSKYWETPVAVIWLYYLSDIPKCALILVVLAKIVKRTLLAGVTVGSRVVDGGNQGYCPTSSQVVNETRPCVDLEVIYDTSRILVALQSRATSFKIVDRCHH